MLLVKAADVQKIHISKSQLHSDFMGHIAIENRLLSTDEMDELAIADGFNSLKAFVDFFDQYYGLPFDGVLIKWISVS